MKAIIPAAGLGTRLLPATKSVPKELHPVRGKPAIHWTLEEAVAAGITEFIVVTNAFKFVLKHYLTPLGRGHPLRDHPDLDDLERLLRDIKIGFVDQPRPNGLGHALLCCRKLIGNEPCAVLLPDNVCPVGSRILKDLLKVYTDYGKSCVVLRHAIPGSANAGAFLTRHLSDQVHEVLRVIPRDDPESTNAETRGMGRYVLEPAAFTYLEKADVQTEMDEVPALNGLAREERLLGMLTEEQVYHLGG
jgi:UTP--glucose-1-phosphate uridylyltransferase